MKTSLRVRFWLETVLALITGILFVVTLVWRDWIEMVFHVDPDQGSGTLEWLIVGVLLVITVALFFMARYEWRRTRTAAA
jgi:hypothetical protein